MSSSTRGKNSTSTHAHANPTPLRDRLAAVLPQGHKFGVHHISTPPTPTEPLCAAPPGYRPDKTYRESHFLALSIQPNANASVLPLKRASPGAERAKEPNARALVFAVEVFVFSTAYQTTLFVSKADSTGYLHLLNLPRGAGSPIRQVCAVFLAYLLDHRRRSHVQSVVNLFARAQAQYLFPGSVRNSGKHVLDDWGLVRWWCKTLNPLMEGLSEVAWASSKGYLLVPGLEEAESRAFVPRTRASRANWVIGHPLERISHYTRELPRVPPRCLIPGYPDDPKSRFRDELDEEVSKRKQGIGAWKSLKTLDQFWEMMAFRQECSSGRLTGFIWLVFDPQTDQSSASRSSAPAQAFSLRTPDSSLDSSLPLPGPATPPRRRVDASSCAQQPSLLKAPASTTASPLTASKVAKKRAKKKLSGRIVPRAPKIKTRVRNYLVDRPTATAYYYWPPEGRGDKLVDETEYKRIVELLLHLDFSTLDKAVGSSGRWLHEAGMGGGEHECILGRAPDLLADDGTAAAAGSTSGSMNGASVTNLTGLVRRKNVPQPSPSLPVETKPDPEPAIKSPAEPGAGLPAPRQANLLGANLVRKKPKAVESCGELGSSQ